MHSNNKIISQSFGLSQEICMSEMNHIKTVTKDTEA